MNEIEKKWHEISIEMIDQAIKEHPGTHLVLDDAEMEAASPDLIPWKAEPVRVRRSLSSADAAAKLSDECLSIDEIRRSALLADWVQVPGDFGRGLCHEEYLEWRTVKDSQGRIVKVEMTTEVPEFWLMLAACDPQALLSTIADFAGEIEIPVEDVYGYRKYPEPYDPFDSSATPAERASRFYEMMMAANSDLRPPLSAYNNGLKAICFMYKRKNSLRAALGSIAAAAFPFAKTVDGKISPANSSEIIFNVRNANFWPKSIAIQHSDSAIVGQIAAHAYYGRKIALAEPIGVYITGFAANRLLAPDGSSLFEKSGAERWIHWSRGVKGLYQRLVIEAPPESGLTLSDLVDRSTRENIRSGYQLARLTEAGIYIRAFGSKTSAPILIEPEPQLDFDELTDSKTFRTFNNEIQRIRNGR